MRPVEMADATLPHQPRLMQTVPKRKHLVLDLDSTCVHSSTEPEEVKQFENLHLHTDPRAAPLRDRIYYFNLIDTSSPPGMGHQTPVWGVLRPYLREFIDFAVRHFDVHVWSAGEDRYVHHICDIIFPPGTPQPVTIYSFNRCKSDDRTGLIVKPLDQLYADLNARGANATNTLAIDDRDDTFSRNPQNGIQIPEYEPATTLAGIGENEYALVKLTGFLMSRELRMADDVRRVEKGRIFTTPLADYVERST